jgi:toxin ParE1/3/4
MGWQVIIAPSARADLADIVCYIAQHNSDAAARLGYELIRRAESLGDFPEMGRMVQEFRQPNLREIICRSYRIIYRLQRQHERIQ